MRPDQTAHWRSDFVLARLSDAPRSLTREATLGRLHRLAPGVYMDADRWRALDPRDRHIATMRAQILQREAPLVFSHWSAAVMHGLPLLAQPDRVHVVSPRANGGRSDRDLQRHCLDIPVGTEVVDGLVVTRVEDTAVHLARVAPFVEGVMVADAALRMRPEGLLDPDAALRGRGAARARRVLSFADPLAETPGESASRVSIRAAGLTSPMLQMEFFDAWGLIRVDFWWPEFGVVGEFDGLVKYVDPRYTGDRTAAEVVIREKRREDRIRRLPTVRTVVRWDYATGRDPVRLGRLLRSAGVR